MGKVGAGCVGVAPVYERARSLASRVGDDRQRCFALIGVQLAYVFQNGSVTSLELAEEAVSVAERIGDPFYKVSAHANLGFSLYLRGDF